MYAKAFDIQHLKTIDSWVGTAENIVLISHMNADGDACGSLLGLMHMLDKAAGKAKRISPILPNGCPKNFEWMPGSDRILSGEKDREVCEKAIGEADLIVCADLNNAGRIDFLQDTLRQAQGKKVLIDHHHNPATEEFDVVVSDPEISSTCELVVWLSQALWGDSMMDTTVARCLYTGLRTDTGGFAFSCSQPSCFEAAALLVQYDIEPADIHNRIMNTFSYNRMQFYGFAINERLQIFPEQKVAMFRFSLEDQQRFGVGGEDMEGLVNYTLMMKDIEVGALLREEKERTKVSLRAKKDVDVNKIAQQLGGGGHTKAAGATCLCAIDQAEAEVKALLGVDGVEPMKL